MNVTNPIAINGARTRLTTAHKSALEREKCPPQYPRVLANLLSRVPDDPTQPKSKANSTDSETATTSSNITNTLAITISSPADIQTSARSESDHMEVQSEITKLSSDLKRKCQSDSDNERARTRLEGNDDTSSSDNERARTRLEGNDDESLDTMSEDELVAVLGDGFNSPPISDPEARKELSDFIQTRTDSKMKSQ
ncbi:hypothetical protein SARC_14901 [Sphaeroforma arctica JP610]|uniref:Uncharacterized protein n=1 Tax=Sphaeroforma arctica JP610 TaxID=667725 RepID=A0A0L0F749_9EUKA|nr:hypothetical protein SARC_14901 [Sphaeroforma arctica JP610]KNC72540.1 hypothetical protein SARC_14901 [Sphaeroforma arctica JP610]|eukprot:XP_014146442.1 hypothetical protein SARC_14901 [Sphaeroforma arctica JP610]